MAVSLSGEVFFVVQRLSLSPYNFDLWLNSRFHLACSCLFVAEILIAELQTDPHFISRLKGTPVISSLELLIIRIKQNTHFFDPHH